MRLPPRLLGAAILLTSLAAVPAFGADQIKIEGFKYSDEVQVLGLNKDGQVQVSIKGNEKAVDLSKVDWIYLDKQDNFNKAEDSRKDAKAASTFYKAAIRNINDPKLRNVAKIRAVGPLDADGNYTEAVSNFLDVYHAAPVEAIWKLHPANMPAETSKMLKDSAGAIKARRGQFTASDAKKNLMGWELDLLTKAKDPGAAALAKEMGGEPVTTVAGGGAAPSASAVTPDAAPAVSGKGREAVASALAAKQYDVAIAEADKELPTAVGQLAVDLYSLKAQAYEGKSGDQNLELAAATWLRISTYYPASSAAPAALLRAAEIQKQLKHDDAAKRLYLEVVEAFPNSSQAKAARSQVK